LFSCMNHNGHCDSHAVFGATKGAIIGLCFGTFLGVGDFLKAEKVTKDVVVIASKRALFATSVLTLFMGTFSSFNCFTRTTLQISEEKSLAITGGMLGFLLGLSNPRKIPLYVASSSSICYIIAYLELHV